MTLVAKSFVVPSPLKLSVSLFVEHSDLDIVHNFEDKEGCYCLKLGFGIQLKLDLSVNRLI